MHDANQWRENAASDGDMMRERETVFTLWGEVEIGAGLPDVDVGGEG